MIDATSLYLAVYHTNMDGDERIVAGHVMGWKLQRRGREFCAAYHNFGLIKFANELDYSMALTLGRRIAKRLDLPFIDDKDNVAYQKGHDDE